MPSTGYVVAKAIRSFSTDLAKASNDNPEFVKAIKLASSFYNKLERLQNPSSCLPKKSRGTSACCKVKAGELE